MSHIRQMEDQAFRFQNLINELKTNQLKLSTAIGVAYSHTNKIYHGQGEFSRSYLQKLSTKFPKVNLHWLLTGVGEMFLPNEYKMVPDMVMEPEVNYKKSKKDVPIIAYTDDYELRKTLGENLKALATRWSMKKNEMFSIIMPGVQKQTVTNYLSGSSAPPLWVLLYLERVTGISISTWITRDILPSEMPLAPLDADAQVGENQLSMVRKDLRDLLERLGG